MNQGVFCREMNRKSLFRHSREKVRNCRHRPPRARLFNLSHGRDGPLIRGRYKVILIDAQEYFLAVARYIHCNPVDAGIVGNIDEYRAIVPNAG